MGSVKRLMSTVLVLSGLKWSGGLTNDAGSEHAERYTLPQAVGLPMEQLARVAAVPGPQKFHVTFTALFNTKAKEIRVRQWPVVPVTGKELVLTPARYYVTVSCRQTVENPQSATLNLDLVAGQTYSVWCESENWARTVVRFKSEPHSQWNAQS